MSRWNLALASLAAAVVFGGCTIYTEDARHPPPPPPTPPAKAPPPPAQAAPPPAGHGGPVLFGRKQPTGGATHATPPPQQANLVVTVTDGTCDITIDTTAHGNAKKVEVNLPAGDHQVTCQPAGGKLQSQIAQVRADVVAAVVFSISNPGNTGTHSLPTGKAPPIGRPMPQ